MRLLLLMLLAAALATGCHTATVVPVAAPPSPIPFPAPTVAFHDATRAAGIAFTHDNGASGHKYMPEAMGSGCAWIDHDGSGRQSLLLVNGSGAPAFYANRGNGRFEDVTRAVGLDVPLDGMGASVGDYDNDGRPDLAITTLRGCRLFHNRGGRFEDATRPSGLAAVPGWCASAAFFDYDCDGRLDLLLTRYVRWSPATDVYQTLDGRSKSYARPDRYKGETCVLLRNLGGGHFQDVSSKAGLDREGKALGVTLLPRKDGFVDTYVANDTVPNFLFVNQRDGTFKESGIRYNVATGDDGRARGGMGTDAADCGNDGGLWLTVTNFSNEMLSLYHDRGQGYFTDLATRAGVGAPSRLFLGFGCLFLDYDLDGWSDLLVANGHIEPEIEHVQQDVKHAERPLLFHNAHDGRFVEVGLTAGDLRRPVVGRGLAWADYDGDGDPDLTLTTNAGPAHLYRNEGGTGHHWLAVVVEGDGKRVNRSAIGTQVFVTAGGVTQRQWVRSGSSYCSQSQLPLLFGLGDADRVDMVEVQWPGSSERQKLGPQTDLARTLRIRR